MTSASAANIPNDDNYRGNLLLEATKEFCRLKKQTDCSMGDRYSKLFYAMIGDTNQVTKKIISSQLARNINTPRTIAYYLAMESIDIAAPFLLISPVFWERDLIQLIEKLDTPYLSILARRSDINAKLAHAIAKRGDKHACKVLARNPVLALNSINLQESLAFEKLNKKPLSLDLKQDAGQLREDAPQQKLMDLANVGGKISRAPTPSSSSGSSTLPTLPERLIASAKTKGAPAVVKIISDDIEMPVDDLQKIVAHESGLWLAVLLKGMHFSRTQASQLLLLVNSSAARNVSNYTASMEQFQRFSVSECHAIMQNLGAKNLKSSAKFAKSAESKTALNHAISARRMQINSAPSKKLFGALRKAG